MWFEKDIMETGIPPPKKNNNNLAEEIVYKSKIQILYCNIKNLTIMLILNKWVSQLVQMLIHIRMVHATDTIKHALHWLYIRRVSNGCQLLVLQLNFWYLPIAEVIFGARIISNRGKSWYSLWRLSLFQFNGALSMEQ